MTVIGAHHDVIITSLAPPAHLGLDIDNIRPMDWKHVTCAHIF